MSDAVFRATKCWGCRYAGGNDDKARFRCLHPDAAKGTLDVAFTALAKHKSWDFPTDFDPLGIEACAGFDRPGSRA